MDWFCIGNVLENMPFTNKIVVNLFFESDLKQAETCSHELENLQAGGLYVLCSWGHDSGSRVLVVRTGNEYSWQVNDDDCNYRLNSVGGSEISSCGGRGQVEVAVVREALQNEWGVI